MNKRQRDAMERLRKLEEGKPEFVGPLTAGPLRARLAEEDMANKPLTPIATEPHPPEVLEEMRAREEQHKRDLERNERDRKLILIPFSILTAPVWLPPFAFGLLLQKVGLEAVADPFLIPGAFILYMAFAP